MIENAGLDNGNAPFTAQDIVNAAKDQLGSGSYQLYSFNDPIPSGVPKDHQFIADVLSGLGGAKFGDQSGNIPSISDWADPEVPISGWDVVSDDPQAGDIVATQKPIPSHWYMSPGQSIGVVTGDGSSIGVKDNMSIAESDFGMQEDHQPTVRRCNQLSSNVVSNDTGNQDQEVGPDINDPMEIKPDDTDRRMKIINSTPSTGTPYMGEDGNRHYDGINPKSDEVIPPPRLI